MFKKPVNCSGLFKLHLQFYKNVPKKKAGLANLNKGLDDAKFSLSSWVLSHVSDKGVRRRGGSKSEHGDGQDVGER
jgi:hypothetical protein